MSLSLRLRAPLSSRAHARRVPERDDLGPRAGSWLSSLWNVRVLVAGGLAIVLVLLGLGAVALERSRLHAEEHQRRVDVEELVDRAARNASDAGDPAFLEQAVADTPFTPAQPQRNQQLLVRFATSFNGESNRSVALFDPAGHVRARLLPAGAPSVRDLDGAWQAALAGRPTVSPVFVFDGVPMRATVAPVGGTDPWAVLVTVNPDQLGQAHTSGIKAFSGQSGGMSDVDTTGTTIASFDPSLVGKQIVDPVDLARIGPGATRTWTLGDGDDQVTYIAERQTATGYTTVSQQSSADLYADLRGQQRRRDVTLGAVLGACLVGLVGFGLALQRSMVRQRARTNALLAGTGDLVLVATRAGQPQTPPRRKPARGRRANRPARHTDATLTYVGEASVDLLGRDPSELVGTPLVDLVHPEEVARLRALLVEPSGTALGVRLRTAPAGGPPNEVADSDTYRWFDIECTDFTSTPAVGGVLMTCHDIGDRKVLEDRLAHQALHDPLTGLANRAAFGAALDSAVVDATATGASVAVLFVDLDRFKPVNDTYGHETGDAVLRVVSRRISEAVRSDDVVGRLGGDEYVAVLPGADETVATRVAARVVATVGQPIAVAGRQVRVGASVGIAVADAADEATRGLACHPAYLLRAADDAMYGAKASGGERWSLAELALPTAAGTTGAVGTTSSPSSISSPAAPAASASPVQSRSGSSLSIPTSSASAVSPSDAPPGPNVQHRDWPPQERIKDDRKWWSRPRPWLRSWAVVGLAAILLSAAFAVAVALENAAEHRAEQNRTSELLGYTYNVAKFSNRGQALKDGASAVPWALDGSDQASMRGIAAQTGGPTIATLFTPDGQPIESYPPGAGALSVDPTSAPFRTALGGAVGNAPMTFIDSAYRLSFLVPVQRNGATAAVLVLAVDIANSIGEQLLESTALTMNVAGVSTVDQLGQAIASWNRNLIGRRLIDPAALRSIPDGRAIEIDDGDPGTLTLAARVTSFRDGAYVIRQLSTSQAYKGLRPVHLARDVMLFAVIAVTLTILTLVTIWRERALRHNEQRLSALLHNAHDIVVVLDRDGKVTFVSSAVVRLLGYTPTFWQGVPSQSGLHPADATRLREQIARELGQDGTHRRPKAARPWFPRAAGCPGPRTVVGTVAHDIRIRAADGAYRWFDIRIQDLSNDRNIRGTLLTSHEISDRKQLQDQLARQAHYDPLTGLANRAELTRRLTSADDRARPGSSGTEQPAVSPLLSVLLVDLDHFKSINDTFGHRTGDAVLQIVADRLSGLCRDDDGVFRLGGDEFVIVLDGADEAVARATAERILAALDEPLKIEDHLVDVGATVGVALSIRHVHGEQVLRNADRAMYRAKQGGRGTVGVYNAFTG